MSPHLVAGAGTVGTALALRLADSGEQVVLLSRSGTGPEHPRVERVAADASSAPTLLALSRGAVAIYNCVNPAYHRWVTDWPPIAAALLAAAEESGAVLATVSNLYGYGPVEGLLTEDLPLAATGLKGRTRAAMWEQALAAHSAGRLRITEVRGSDYLCPGSQAHLGDRVMRPLLAGRTVRVLPSADTSHTWTSTDDVAALLARVATDERAWGRAWHVPSVGPRSQRQAVNDLAAAAGLRTVRVGEVPRPLLAMLGLVSPVMRELPEVAHQFEHDFVLDSTAAQRTFGLGPTPWEEQVERQVAAYRR